MKCNYHKSLFSEKYENLKPMLKYDEGSTIWWKSIERRKYSAIFLPQCQFLNVITVHSLPARGIVNGLLHVSPRNNSWNDVIFHRMVGDKVSNWY